MTKSDVMRDAWRIARNGAKKFGGKVSEYLSEAMKIAWKNFKEYVEYEAYQAERMNIATIDQNIKIEQMLKGFLKIEKVTFDIDELKSIISVWSEKGRDMTKEEASKTISDLINFKKVNAI